MQNQTSTVGHNNCQIKQCNFFCNTLTTIQNYRININIVDKVMGAFGSWGPCMERQFRKPIPYWSKRQAPRAGCTGRWGHGINLPRWQAVHTVPSDPPMGSSQHPSQRQLQGGVQYLSWIWHNDTEYKSKSENDADLWQNQWKFFVF